MQPYMQLLATILANGNATLKKYFKNYIYLHNKLQLVANAENEYTCGTNTNITKKHKINKYCNQKIN